MFRFKQFRIAQDQCAMKVGTDGVLLGAWAEVASANTILDIGTGTGLLALMCAQHNANAQITAIEIDADAAQQAKANVAASPWANRINVQHSSLEEFASTTEQRFDLIICNPPYFNDAAIDARSQARQQASLGIDAVVQSADLLSDNGQFALIAPVDYGEQFARKITEKGLFITRKCQVFGQPGVAAKRLLLQCSRNESSLEESELIIEEFGRHHYSAEYKALTGEFYLAKD